MTAFRDSNRRWLYVGAAALDSFIVGSFAVIGRDNHDLPAAPLETIRVAAPFLIALAIAWSVPANLVRPWSLRSGLVIGALTVGGGLVLRSVAFGDGISGAFPVVTAGYMIGLMVGFRAIGALRTGGAE